MAITQNTYTGNGTTVLFSFTFPYLETTDIKVSLNGTVTTAYTLANATTIQFNTAPANGAAIRIYRQTDDAALAATFYPGSAIRSNDLNKNFTQNLYVTQESTNNAATATTTANSALTNAATAINTANSAVGTANTASANATSAVNTANTASGNASAAVSTANSATSTANTALSTANAASSAVANALLFVTVANVAAIPASPANNAAVEVINSTNIQGFTPLANLPAGFVGSPGLSVRLIYSTSGNTWNFIQYFPNDPETRYLKLSGGTLTGAITGTQTGNILPFFFQTFAGLPSPNTYHGAVAHAHDTGALYYAHAGQWQQLANVNSPTFTGTVTIPAGASISGYLTSATASSTYQTQAGMSSYLTTATAGTTYAPLASPTFTGTVTIPAGASISGYLTSATASSTYQTQAGMSSYLTTSTASSTYQPISSMSSYLTAYATTTTAVNKTLVNRERCTVIAGGLTITLPASPSAGNEVTVTVGGSFTNTTIARNGSNIMSLAENLTIDKANISVTLYYVDATRGWRII